MRTSAAVLERMILRLNSEPGIEKDRHPLARSVIEGSMHTAVGTKGISKTARCHTLRDCTASNLLDTAQMAAPSRSCSATVVGPTEIQVTFQIEGRAIVSVLAHTTYPDAI